MVGRHPSTRDVTRMARDAQKGSSAQAAAYHRALQDEVAISMGFHVCNVLADGHKFYENVDLIKVATDAVAHGFSMTIMRMLLQIYMALRVISIDGCMSEGTCADNGIVAGCQEACNLAKAIVYTIIVRCHVEHPMVSIRAYIDDFPLRQEGTERFLMLHIPEAT